MPEADVGADDRTYSIPQQPPPAGTGLRRGQLFDQGAVDALCVCAFVVCGEMMPAFLNFVLHHLFADAAAIDKGQQDVARHQIGAEEENEAPEGSQYDDEGKEGQAESGPGGE